VGIGSTRSWLTITSSPLFFISIAFKRLSDAISSLFAILTGDFISIDSKQLRGRLKSKGETGK
jgi:hypothetical protein